MAKRKKSTKSKRSGLYKVETYGIGYNSNTFLVLLAFVVIVAMVFVAKMTGIKLY